MVVPIPLVRAHSLSIQVHIHTKRVFDCFSTCRKTFTAKVNTLNEMKGNLPKDQKRLRIYIAGPYTNGNSGSLNDNVRRAIDIGLRVWKKGHYPFIPHLTHFVDLFAKERGIRMDWRDYIEWDRPWLEICDALLYIASSRGADLELAKAKAQGLRIYTDVDQIPEINEDKKFPITERLVNVEQEK